METIRQQLGFNLLPFGRTDQRWCVQSSRLMVKTFGTFWVHPMRGRTSSYTKVFARTNYQDPPGMNVFYCIFVSSEHQKVPASTSYVFSNAGADRVKWLKWPLQGGPQKPHESHPNIKHHLKWSQWNAEIPWNSQQKNMVSFGVFKKRGMRLT